MRHTITATALILSLVSLTVNAVAQTQALRFEVASIKPCKPEPGTRTGGGNSSPGRLNLTCSSVKGLINHAYLIFENGQLRVGLPPPIQGGPDWINSQYYEINAVAEEHASLDMMNGPMLQKLLEDQFKLRVHRETPNVAVYALMVTKGGPKLQPFKEGSCSVIDRTQFASIYPPPSPQQIKKNCNARGRREGAILKVEAQGMTLDEFARIFLDSHTVDRPVINKTGIEGRFDFHLEYAPDRGGPADDPAGGPSIFTALQEQLGLKLESAKGPGELLVIDGVERPSEN